MAGQRERRLTIRGAVGQVRWSYAVAAELTGYTVTKKGDAWTLTGTIRTSNAFQLAQRPLTFIAPHANGAWKWSVQDCHVDAGVLTAQLGPPEG